MSTTIARDVPRPAPTLSDSGPVRFVPVRSNLLPDEIVAGRRTDRMRRRVVIGLVSLVAVLAMVFGFSWWQTQQADDGLDAARQDQTALQQQTRTYAPLVNAKAQTTSIQTRLQRLMVGDLSWRGMLTALRAQAPSGVRLTQVGGAVRTAAGGEGATDTDPALAALNQSGSDIVGLLTITGTAPDKNAVAAFVESLAKVKGLSSPIATNVATVAGSTTFTGTALITTAALGGPYSNGPKTGPGGN